MAGFFSDIFEGISTHFAESRLDRLWARLNATPRGKKLVDALRKADIDLALTKKAPQAVSLSQPIKNRRMLVLDSRMSDDLLLLHLARFSSCYKEYAYYADTGFLSPAAEAALNGFNKADADFEFYYFAYEQNITHLIPHVHPRFNLATAGNDRFEKWPGSEAQKNATDQALHIWSNDINKCIQDDRKPCFLSPAQSDNWVMRSIRKNALLSACDDDTLRAMFWPSVQNNDSETAALLNQATTLYENTRATQAKSDKANKGSLEALLARFGSTPAGAALLAFADANRMSFSMNYALQTLGTIGSHNDGKIELNPFESDDVLIGTLAHELRHALQHRAVGDEFLSRNNQMTPETAIAFVRLIETDARVFQQKFVEDFAARTGDSGPRDAFLKRLDVPPMGKSDQERFWFYLAFLKRGGSYDARLLQDIPELHTLRRKDLDFNEKNPLLTQKESVRLLLAAARRIDLAWPFAPRPKEPSNYLAKVSDRLLLQELTTGMHPELEKAHATDIKKMQEQHAALVKKRTKWF